MDALESSWPHFSRQPPKFSEAQAKVRRRVQDTVTISFVFGQLRAASPAISSSFTRHAPTFPAKYQPLEGKGKKCSLQTDCFPGWRDELGGEWREGGGVVVSDGNDKTASPPSVPPPPPPHSPTLLTLHYSSPPRRYYHNHTQYYSWALSPEQRKPSPRSPPQVTGRRVTHRGNRQARG